MSYVCKVLQDRCAELLDGLTAFVGFVAKDCLTYQVALLSSVAILLSYCVVMQACLALAVCQRAMMSHSPT